ESPSGNSIAQPYETLPGILHLQHLGAARTELLDDDAEEILRHVDHQLLVRLESLAVHPLAGDHTRTRHLELESFTPHGLHQDREMQLATPGDRPRVRRLGVLDAECDVALEL